MSNTTQTNHAWRIDGVRMRNGSSAVVKALTGETGTGMTGRGVDARGQACAPSGLIGRWNRAMRSWARERLTRFGRPSARFEEIVHDFARTIEIARSAGAVEAALLVQARRMLPACRVQLITEMTLTDDQSPTDRPTELPAVSASAPSVSPRNLNGGPSLEVPLNCGSARHGWLRVRMRTTEAASLPRATVRRLTTLCTMAACAFETLGRPGAWPEYCAADDLSEIGIKVHSGGGSSGSTAAAIAKLHDATFLNAVLPFALAQARRHHEPLSVLCIAIDRLAGIEELLGPHAVDNLVSSVGGTVAAHVRDSDIIARLYDDRVVAVLPRAPGGGALHVAQRICQEVKAKRQEECAPEITVSIGVATFPASADNVYSLFDAADLALAQAQSLGRNRACLAPKRTAVTAGCATAVSCSS
jgi:diguanylate cyclase (GGDEF)-like protein